MIMERTISRAFVAVALLFQAAGARAEKSIEALRDSSELSAIELPAPSLEKKPLPGRLVDSESAYDELYAAGRAPNPAEIQGDWRGVALVFARREPLPRIPALERLIELVSLKLWEGKAFLNAGGANRFLGGRLKLFRFTTELRPSRTGSGQALGLDYGSNPYPISAVRDEVRLLADGRLLGRAYISAPDGKEHFLFYFLLARTEANS